MSRRTLVAAWLAMALTASAASAGELEIERMTSPEVAERVKSGETTILIPTGGVEQNGPHMVLGKHNFIVRETARRIAEKLGDALVAPVLAYVPEGDIAKREGHMAFPGTISVPPPVFAAVLEAAAESFHAHGFKTIVFLGDSGPNQEPQKAVARKLSGDWAGDGTRVVNADSYYAANGGLEWLKSEGETDAAIGTHAAIRDTSELMAVFPDGVRPGKAVADKDGVIGDAGRASAERGAKLIDLKVAAALKDIAQALAQPAGGATGGGAQPKDSLWTRVKRLIFG